jgi:hypothetical protein
MTKQKTSSTPVSKKVAPNKKVAAKKQLTKEKEEEKKRIQEIKDFDKSEKFLFTCFDITEDAVIKTIYPEDLCFFEKYLEYFVTRRGQFLAEMEENKRMREKEQVKEKGQEKQKQN